MTKRREFLKQSLLLGTAATLVPSSLFAAEKKSRLVILHTNDWHSRVDPFPMDGGKLQGQGGAAKRKTLIDRVRKEEEHVLLFDCGDIFQGTPYFNLYKGELEFKLMSQMGYDAATLGNHDFDAGLDGLLKQLPHAEFDFVCTNYDFSNTLLAGKIQQHKIIHKGPWKIGVIGICIELKGLVPDLMFEGTRYLDPIAKANEKAAWLKKEQNCDLVVCLSHLGHSYSGTKVSDMVLAKETEHVDIILGGHTHTFLDEPLEIMNKKAYPVIVTQAGWGGVILGRLDLEWTKGKTRSKPRTSMLKVS